MTLAWGQKRHIIFDIHGVLLGLTQSARLPAQQTLDLLRTAGYPLRFVTNSSSVEPQHLANELQRHGIIAEPNEIFTAATSAAVYLANLAQGLKVYLIGSSTLRQEIQRVCGDQIEWVKPEAAEVIVVSRDPELDDTIIRRLAANRCARIVATCRDATFSDQQGCHQGPAECVARVEQAMQQTAFVIGKPNPYVLTHVMRLSPLEMRRSLIVGDSLEQDIALAASVQAESVLMKINRSLDLPIGRPRPQHVIAEMSELLSLVETA